MHLQEKWIERIRLEEKRFIWKKKWLHSIDGLHSGYRAVFGWVSFNQNKSNFLTSDNGHQQHNEPTDLKENTRN